MALTYQEIYDMIDDLLADNTTQEISEEDLRDVCHAILDRTNESDIESLDIEWDSGTTYALDELVTYLNRIWKSKSAGNTNHQPPSDPEVTEDTYWIEQSKSESSPIKEWSAGVYGAGLIVVLYNDELYKLTVGTRPYNSSNIEDEIESGDWQIVASSGYITRMIVIDNTTLKTLYSSPYELVPAPGPDKYAKFVEGVFLYKYGTATFSNDTYVAFTLNGSQVSTAHYYYFNTATADKINSHTAQSFSSYGSMLASDVFNKSIDLEMGADLTGSGDGTAVVFIKYLIIDFS